MTSHLSWLSWPQAPRKKRWWLTQLDLDSVGFERGAPAVGPENEPLVPVKGSRRIQDLLRTASIRVESSISTPPGTYVGAPFINLFCVFLYNGL
jgi:hypothetical protein